MRALTAFNEAALRSMASATTTDMNSSGCNTVIITGSNTITSLGSVPAGAVRRLVFEGAPALVHNSISLILPGSGNIVAAAGDVAEFVSLGGGNWRCISFQRSTGLPVNSSDQRLSTAWVNFNGNGTIAIRGSVGIGSVTRHALGDYSCTFSTDMLTVNYTVHVTLGELEGNAFVYGRIPTGKGLSSFRFRCIQVGGSYADVSQIDVTFFGGR